MEASAGISTSDTTARSIVHSVNPKGYAFLQPILARGDKFIFLHQTALKSGAWGEIQPGTWVSFRLEETAKGFAALDAAVIDPTPIDQQQRLLARYSATHGMAGGTNPRSQRLDGLTADDAKEQMKRGILSKHDYYAGMSENGLQAVALAWGIPFVPGERERFVRAVLDAIAMKASPEGNRQR
jgi:cold shock CspA family protein